MEDWDVQQWRYLTRRQWWAGFITGAGMGIAAIGLLLWVLAVLYGVY